MTPEERVRRHVTGQTDRVAMRSYWPGARRWYAPWSRTTMVSFENHGGNPSRCEEAFGRCAAELRSDALRPGFRGGFVEWVTIRDHWTGEEDLRWLWGSCTPVEVRRLSIAADRSVVDTGAMFS